MKPRINKTEKNRNTKFYENLSSGSWVVPCRQTDNLIWQSS